jgi:hypothetical protein
MRQISENEGELTEHKIIEMFGECGQNLVLLKCSKESRTERILVQLDRAKLQ